MNFTGLHGLKSFSFDLIAIIAHGNKEKISVIENEIENRNITNYLYSKYSNLMMIPLNNDCIYDLESWNRELSEYTGWVEGNESRKFGIINDDDGLLLLLGLVIDLLKDAE